MRFSDIRHQDRALGLLHRGLRSGRTPHAFLFEGPEGVGKGLTAEALAARLLCQAAEPDADTDACGSCDACRLFAAGNHPDFARVHRGLHKLHPDRTIRTSKGLFLVVDVIRHFLIEPATSSPSVSARKVFVIDAAERMNEGAQNALLKTLEEPPGAAHLILVTASSERLLPTIRSRCQSVRFDLLPRDFVAEQLADRAGLAGAQAAVLAQLADGRLGVALRWHRIGLLDALAAVDDLMGGGEHERPEAFSKRLLEIASELAARDPQDADEENPDESDEDGGGAGGSGSGKKRTSSRNIPTDQMRDAMKLVLMLVADRLRLALRASCDLGGPGASERTGAKGSPAVARWQRLDADALAERVSGVFEAEQMLDRNVQPQLVGERLAAVLAGACLPMAVY